MLALALLACLSTSTGAAGPTAPFVDVDDARAAIGAYHAGEAGSSVAVVVAGGLSVLGGGALMFVDDDLARGLGASLAVVGALGAAGFGYYLWIIPGLVSDLEARLADDPQTLARDEALRLRGVIDRFIVLQAIEGGVAVAALVAAAIGAGTENDIVTGVGLGVASGAIGLFIYDALAADRARRYRATFE